MASRLFENMTDSLEYNEETERTLRPIPGGTQLEWRSGFLCLILLIALIVFGNLLVVLAVVCDRKLRSITTNKFIASLAVSDLLVGIVVMPLSLYAKVNNDRWDLGPRWCRFHLVTGVFSTTASIVHLVAISLDRYFAIMFPTEYQRHSVSTSALPYVVMIWVMSFAVSSTLFMEKTLDSDGVCWIENHQYLVLSSILSFFLPGAIVVYLYVKIFRKLRNHQLFIFGQAGNMRRNYTAGKDKRRSLPRVIIEEVRSRRGSRLSQTGSNSGSPTRRSSSGSHKSERSPSQPEIHNVSVVQQRWRSPTICAETLEHDRSMAAKKRVSIVPDPPSVDFSSNIISMTAAIRDEHMASMGLLNDNSNPAVKQDLTLPAVTMVQSRRQSGDCGMSGGKPLPAPILAAFNKAYQEVTQGNDRRRRNSLFRDSTEADVLNANETSLNEPELSTKRPLLLSVPNPERLKPIPNLRSSCLSSKIGLREEPTSLLTVPTVANVNTPPLSPIASTASKVPPMVTSLKVPKVWDYAAPACGSVPSSGNSSHSSYTSASGSDETYRRISMNSYGSSLTDITDSTYEIDSRRSSAWSTLRTAVLAKHLVVGAHFGGTSKAADTHADDDIPPRIVANGSCPGKKMSTISRGKLRRIATQVTRAIRRKRRESMAIRRESRATRVVAAILIAFLICWIPYFCVTVYRGVCKGIGMKMDKQLHVQLFVVSSWLGYAHSCFNPVIYMCLNRNFRRTLRKLLCFWKAKVIEDINK